MARLLLGMFARVPRPRRFLKPPRSEPCRRGEQWAYNLGKIFPNRQIAPTMNAREVLNRYAPAGRCDFRRTDLRGQSFKLQTSTLAHFDETGLRMNGKLWWLHVVCTTALTYDSVQLKRGQAAMEAMNILPNFQGKAVHDGWKSYQADDHCEHFLCNAHHLRELKFIWERHHQVWAYQMSLFLSSAKAIVDHARASGRACLDSAQLQQLAARYHRLLDEGLAAHPATPDPEPDTPKKRGRPKQSVAKNLLDRLKTQHLSVLGFVHDFAVPFDNNQAGRDIRMMKLKQKISGSFRSQTGAQMFCRIRGYLSTLTKQGIDVLDALTSLFMGDLVLPDFSAE
jgi:transposase